MKELALHTLLTMTGTLLTITLDSPLVRNRRFLRSSECSSSSSAPLADSERKRDSTCRDYLLAIDKQC
jgi:hypothetical protein